MKKKINNAYISINKSKISEPKQINDNNSLNIDFSSFIKKFYESSSKYMQSMRNCLKEINVNITSNKSISLNESANKCISSLNIIFSYLDSSFNQFFSNIQKYLEFVNLNNNKYLKMSYSTKKPNLTKNYISSQFYNDNNNLKSNNSLYSNYQLNKIDTKTLYKNKRMSKMNTTTDINKTELYNSNSNIDEKMGNFRGIKDLNRMSTKNLFEENILNTQFIENVKNLLNILKYERINDIGIAKKSQYQIKLDNFKENLISELSNAINDKKEKDNNHPMHRRIRSVNLSSNSFNYINNINEDNNKINELVIQENDEKINDETEYNIINKNKTTENMDSLYFLDNNDIDNNKNNLNIFNNIKININKENDGVKENEKLKNENELLEKNKKELLIQIADLINKNNSLNEEISILNNSILKKTENENTSNEKINELNKEIKILTDKKNKLDKNNNEYKKSIDLYEKEKSSNLKELKKLKENIEELKRENKLLNNNLTNTETENKKNKKNIKELKSEIDDLNKAIGKLVNENEKMNNQIDEIISRKEEYKEKYKKADKELNDEKNINLLLEEKVKKLEKKLEENNINEFDDTKTKTYKITNINKVNEIEVEKLPRKYVSPYNYRKNTSAFSTNNTSNNRKILITNNIEDLEITPENYSIVKFFQLNKNLKWYLLKRTKKLISEPADTSPPSSNQSNSNQLFRRYKYLKINSKLNNERREENFNDFIWRPIKNEKDFINFNFINIDNNENNNNKNENSLSKDWQKKINELEFCIKDLEEKLEKKENDCNRINLNYAKLFKRSKQPDMSYDKLVENYEKLKSENKLLLKK